DKSRRPRHGVVMRAIMPILAAYYLYTLAVAIALPGWRPWEPLFDRRAIGAISELVPVFGLPQGAVGASIRVLLDLLIFTPPLVAAAEPPSFFYGRLADWIASVLPVVAFFQRLVGAEVRLLLDPLVFSPPTLHGVAWKPSWAQSLGVVPWAVVIGPFGVLITSLATRALCRRPLTCGTMLLRLAFYGIPFSLMLLAGILLVMPHVGQAIAMCGVKGMPVAVISDVGALTVLGLPWLVLSHLVADAFFSAAKATRHRRLSRTDASLTQRHELVREWTGRFNGYLLLAGAAWLAVATTVLVLPSVLDDCLTSRGGKLLASVGGVSGAMTMLLGWSRFSGDKRDGSGGSKITANVILAIVAPLFCIILAMGTANAVTIAATALWRSGAARETRGLETLFTDELRTAPLDEIWFAVQILLGMIAAVGVLSLITRQIDINRFSLHSFYRNRLQRAFLGPSQRYEVMQELPAGTRRAPDEDLFTDFNVKADIRVAELHPAIAVGQMSLSAHRPAWPLFPIINMALNTVSSSRYLWQERRAAPFTASPLHAGTSIVRNYGLKNELGAYRSSCSYGGPGGLSLASAMAISGAAASPNMGYHSSPGITLLLALFNVRLGWWLGNPLNATTHREPGPRSALKPFITEALGQTNEWADYVYLSDGGHFENLGLYEMVLRRCRFIIVSDAGADGQRHFADLGNAVRKVYIDHGIRITFRGLPALRDAIGAEEERIEPFRFAIGRIHYKEAHSGVEGIEDGFILYVKPTLDINSLPVSVQSYALANPSFPHESTADQWFGESQFEAYRALGAHIMGAILDEADRVAPGATGTIAEVLTALEKRGNPRAVTAMTSRLAGDAAWPPKSKLVRLWRKTRH
ncbi:MAG TPA: hypothetical protein PK264_07335, partial [Hyphomicrobiaceae bacterium]|nr:hypothetical protein [Hyphomicrobiaceae bacterium]